MKTKFMVLFTTTIHMILLAGCSARELVPQQSTSTSTPPYAINQSPASSQEEPTDSNLPAPTALQSASPDPPQTIDEILNGFADLPFVEFLNQSFRELQLRDPDNLILNDFSEFYNLPLNDQFTNLSIDYRDRTEELERGTLAVLHSYDRSIPPRCL